MTLKQVIESSDTRAGRTFDLTVQFLVLVSLVSFVGAIGLWAGCSDDPPAGQGPDGSLQVDTGGAADLGVGSDSGSADGPLTATERTWCSLRTAGIP